MYRPDLDFQVFSVRGLWGKKGCFLQPAGRRSRPMRTLGPCSGALQAVFPPCLADCGLPRNRISSAMTPGEYDPDRISSAMAAVAGKKKAFFWFFWPPGGKKKQKKSKNMQKKSPPPDPHTRPLPRRPGDRDSTPPARPPLPRTPPLVVSACARRATPASAPR